MLQKETDKSSKRNKSKPSRRVSKKCQEQRRVIIYKIILYIYDAYTVREKVGTQLIDNIIY